MQLSAASSFSSWCLQQDKPTGNSVTGKLASVSIEIGTHRSGWASSMQDNTEGGIVVRVPEGNSQGEKTDTAVLLDSKIFEVIAFGSSARSRYVEDEAAGRLFLTFTNLRDPVAVAECGSTVSPVGLLAAVLDHFKTAALAHLSSVSKTPIAVDDVAWVMPVPATIDTVARRLLRRAAVRSGMIDAVNSPQLEFCPQSKAAYLAVYDQESPALLREVGTRTMIVDCGASTVDITTHEVVSSNPLRLKELIPTTVEAWGSTCVDQAFAEWFKSFLGTDAYSRVCQMSSFYDLMKCWEECKTKFEGRPKERFKFNMADISCELNINAGNIEVSAI